MEPVSPEHRVNVMLTPQFYTMKKEELPLKYRYQAKKIAPSLFDGLLDENGTYEYFVFKEEGQWVFIAYDPEKIRTFLHAKGISTEYLSKLFFVQQAAQAFSQPIALNEEESLVTIDGVVVQVPANILPEGSQPGSFSKIVLPKMGITLSAKGNQLIHKRETAVLSIIFLLFASIFFIEGWGYGQSLKVQSKEMQELMEAYPSLQSKMQRESISLKYRMIDSKERKKREIIKTLAAMIFKGVVLTAYHMDEKQFKVTFNCENAKVAKRVQSLAKQANFKVSSKDNNSVVIEGKV
jgi:hypothetical protein